MRLKVGIRRVSEVRDVWTNVAGLSLRVMDILKI